MGIMLNGDLENLLGTNVNDLSFGTISKIEMDDNRNVYSASNFEKNFFSKKYHTIAFETDNKEIIKSFNFTMYGNMDKTFYNQIVENYGPPQQILKRDSIVKQVKETLSGGTKTVSTKGTLKECAFDDNPLLIIWKNDRFIMQFTLPPQLNRIDLNFKIPSEEIIFD